MMDRAQIEYLQSVFVPECIIFFSIFATASSHPAQIITIKKRKNETGGDVDCGISPGYLSEQLVPLMRQNKPQK